MGSEPSSVMNDERRKGHGPSFVRVRRESRPPTPKEGLPPPPGPAPDVHTRIVIPRYAQGRAAYADIEVREVRYGATSRTPYLRIVPSRQPLAKKGPGRLEATLIGSRPRDILGRYWADIRRFLIGSPFATSQAIHERLSNLKALAVFSSDALSSSAYATEEILIVLALAGADALHFSLPIALAIVSLMAIVVASYRQTIKAYPQGGGAYSVARENLGEWPGLVAAAALLVDYTLTVAVSVAAGVAAITSAAPGLLDWRVPIAVAIVLVFAWGNLRGIRESGTIFSIPTYFFITSMGVVIALGMIKVAMGEAPGTLWRGAPVPEPIIPQTSLSLLLILRAFSSGSAALTGIEAMANGVPSFKPPESHNARITTLRMAVILSSLFLGITFLANRYGLVPREDETLVSQLGRQVLGENPLYFVYQAATALVLFLAANTSFADFPRVSAILAADKYLPRYFTFKGDRLAFTNGIVALSIAASALLVIFDANVTRLIPLYAVGVFVTFTLSQLGMVRRWWRLRGPGWRTSMLINAVGAVATGVVAVIIVLSKFVHGAWISLLLMGWLIVIFHLIWRHYRWFESQVHITDEEVAELAAPPSVPLAEGASVRHFVIPVEGINRITLETIRVAREWGGTITALHVTDDREEGEALRAKWEHLLPDVPLILIESPYRAFVAPMLACLEHMKRSEGEVILLLPRLKVRHWWQALLHNQTVLRLRPHAEKYLKIRVLEVPVPLNGASH